MDSIRIRERLGILLLAILGLSAAALTGAQIASPQSAECSSGKLAAKLTGWMIDNQMPHGNAEFANSALKVSVTTVNYPDGTVLAVFDGDNQIGSLPGLKSGNSEGSISITKAPSEGASIRVMKDDRPIVSGSLVCKEQAKQ